ncbi:MAG: hypothetical protein LBL49_01265 [Clostridiales Family XIII bacterium]|jgi:hypothetical protein|nr:hypothetical protein [Clostridiales Family XIII bacterium]
MKKNIIAVISLAVLAMLSVLVMRTSAGEPNNSNVESISIIIDAADDSIREIVYIEDINADNALEKLGVDVNKEEYSGVYIDDDGNLVLMLVEDSESLNDIVYNTPELITGKSIKSRTSSDDGNVLLMSAKYSADELDAIIGFLLPSLDDFGILCIETDVISNTVGIGLLNADETAKNTIIDALYENVELSGKSIEDALEFKYMTEDDIPQLLTR